MKKCIAVIGMHRSGTSVVTKALEILGVNLGQNLIPVANDNRNGFWEDKSIIDLNDRILALAGMTWFSVSEYPFALLNSEQGRSLEKEALDIISRRIDAYPLWAFKDPRCGRLLPFWQKVFMRLNVALSYLVVLRNPLDVAASLEKRNDFKLAMSQHLWLVHTFQNLKLLKNKEVCFVSFDDFLNEPEKHLQRFSLCFNLPIDKFSMASFTEKFINPGLRHSHSTLEDLASLPGVFPFVQKLYTILSKIADGSNSLATLLECWDELEREYLKTTHASLHEFCLHAHTRNVDVENLINLLTKDSVTLAEQHRLIERQLIEIDQLKAEQHRLIEHQLIEIDQLKKALNLICNSTTWRMTKPLRDMITMVKKREIKNCL